ncbi:FAD dependent oxidoreductase [Annulohypoxylon maeteangense]|uniref:FAD dependent oxidoreductase n=1 Tax=Annulohypoxylon maeteangense TaxID=1927788 RepID=UPI002008B013|nr:FAD dependent oxidoreductase [Annulohypoxylon maeteangense]KAI0888380.1 FAD dependent oxidoreductase [Annulohypoxylon maeteangense]
MDQRAAIPVTLPRDNPTQSYWQLEPDEIADLRSTSSLPDKADTVIIGSGITGAAVAFNLLSNGARDVVMLEARQACSGATGRNGGHTKAASYRSFLGHQKDHGTAMAAKIARMELANIRAVHAFARDHGIKCDSTPCDTVDVVYEAAQWELDQKAVKAMQDAMPDDDAAKYTLHSREDVWEKFFCGRGGDESVCGGVSYEAGSLSAYQFGVGVLKLCLAKGLNLHTNTPALNLEKLEGGGWKVETPRGVITAGKVVLATNGYTASVWKRFQGVIVPLRGHVTAQRPGLDMPKEGLPGTYSFIYEGGYDYMIPRPKGSKFEGDIVIGGALAKAPADGLEEYGTTDDTAFNEVIMKSLDECLRKYFGDNWGADNSEGRIRKSWTGIMGFSPDGFPFVGEMPGEKDLWVSTSFQGHGMVLCWMCARALVTMMGDGDEKELDAWFPEIFKINEQRLRLTFRGRLS